MLRQDLLCGHFLCDFSTSCYRIKHLLRSLQSIKCDSRRSPFSLWLVRSSGLGFRENAESRVDMSLTSTNHSRILKLSQTSSGYSILRQGTSDLIVTWTISSIHLTAWLSTSISCQCLAASNLSTSMIRTLLKPQPEGSSVGPASAYMVANNMNRRWTGKCEPGNQNESCFKRARDCSSDEPMAGQSLHRGHPSESSLRT